MAPQGQRPLHGDRAQPSALGPYLGASRSIGALWGALIGRWKARGPGRPIGASDLIPRLKRADSAPTSPWPPPRRSLEAEGCVFKEDSVNSSARCQEWKSLCGHTGMAQSEYSHACRSPLARPGRVAQLAECHPKHQGVASSIPGSGAGVWGSIPSRDCAAGSRSVLFSHQRSSLTKSQ